MPRRSQAARRSGEADDDDDFDDDDEEDLDTGLGGADDMDDPDVEDLGRVVHSYSWGKKYMLHRRLVGEPAVWAPCHGTAEGHMPDSRVHRYDNLVGYRPSTANQAEMDSSENVRAAWERQRQQTAKNLSHPSRVNCQAMFERWALARVPNSPYVLWLIKIEQLALAQRPDALEEHERFVPPPAALVKTWIDELRLDPANPQPRPYDHKGGTIKNMISALSATCLEFSAPPVGKEDVVKTEVKKWLKKDGHKSSEAFDMEKDMKKLFVTIWTLQWRAEKQLMAWAMLLLAIVLFGRASCMTTYCPLVQDLELPEAEQHWDADGLPTVIFVSFRKWKWRSESRCCGCDKSEKCTCGNLFKVRVHRNYLDSRFCPVFWLLTWLNYSIIITGPIFQKLEETQLSLRRKRKRQRNAAQVPEDISDEDDAHNVDNDPSPPAAGTWCTGAALSEAQWTTMTRHWFTKAGLYFPAVKEKRPDASGQLKEYVIRKARGVTNQGIRRSAAQWAWRCGAKMPQDVANNGR
jgi:hypothetical protein